jgi:hypothetical protein
MKKVFLAVLIVFFATAVYAGTYVDPLATSPQANRDKIYPTFGTPLVQFDISGEFDARGYYWDNFAVRKDSTATPTVTNSYMRGYLDLWPKLKVGDTQLITKIQMRDQNPWAKFNSAVGSEAFDKNYDVPSTTSDRVNISVERAYIHHNFNDKWFTEVGLMNGQVWGTTFGDFLQPRWRVKFQGMTDFGAVGVLYEKLTEVGTAATEDSEKDDYNAYALYGVTKAGDLTIEPLFYYHVDSAFYRVIPLGQVSVTPPITATRVLNGQDQGSKGAKILYISLASKGKLGPLGMEGEVTYKKTDVNKLTSTTTYSAVLPVATDVIDNKWTEIGAYLNLWNDLDIGRIGGRVAYGNWDKKGGIIKNAAGKYTGAGTDFREDFKSNLILGDEIGFGSAGSSTAEDLVGMTLIQPYIKNVKLGMDKLTGSASFGYMMSNQKDTIWEKTNAMEVDLGVQYKLSDNLIYMVDTGYAKVSVDKDHYGASSPDAIMVLKHEILLTF